LARRLADVSAADERLERPGLAELEDHADARDPVVAFAVDQMADDVERRPGVAAFVRLRPGIGQIAKQGVERPRRAGEQRDGVRQILRHRIARSWRIIQLTPNRSRHCPNRLAKNVSCSGMNTWPPSDSARNTRSASASLSTASDR